ncbi:MAG: DNA alkylation repair protein [Patescibacteria group bacterium]
MTTLKAKDLEALLVKRRDVARGIFLQRFFKTGPGEYCEGDLLLGLTVPSIRKEVKAFKTLPLSEIGKLLASKWHEVRLAAVIILAEQAKKTTDEKMQNALATFYVKHADRVNSWDLVDSSVEHVLGPVVAKKGFEYVKPLIGSKLFWKRRMAMVSMFYLIRRGQAELPLQVAEALLHDEHDLMQKAVGWMLREVGKRASMPKLNGFLESHAATMPRTTLRYAIERHPDFAKKRFMQMKQLQNV